MKKTSSIMLTFIGICFFALCSPVQALEFTVSEISFSPSVDTEKLKWTVNPQEDTDTLTHELSEGDVWTFTYGYFTITNPINSQAGSDDDDSFSVSFKIESTNSVTNESSIGKPDATYVQASQTDYGWVDFDNTSNDISIAGGAYSLSFLDAIDAKYNVPLALMATITLESYTASDPDLVTSDEIGSAAIVPEPSTIILLGCGLVGLGMCMKKRKKI